MRHVLVTHPADEAAQQSPLEHAASERPHRAADRNLPHHRLEEDSRCVPRVWASEMPPAIEFSAKAASLSSWRSFTLPGN